MNKRDEMIIEQGYSCYWNGKVGLLQAKDSQIYSATVTVEESLQVELLQDEKGDIIWEQCRCTCQDGPYCKHVMAVYFSLRNRVDI